MLGSCGESNNEAKKTTATKSETYDLAALQESKLAGGVHLPGVLQPFEAVQIYPKINGFVKTVAVDRGSVVKKGTVLMRLEAPEMEEHIAEAKLKYTHAQSVYAASKDRYERMLATSKTPGTISPYDLAAANSKMLADEASAKGELSNIKAQQDVSSYLTITAPFDGVITERNVHPGALVGPGTQGSKPMLVLQQQSKLRLVVSIPEQYSAQVKNADEVHFKVNALQGKEFSGTISRSSGDLNTYRAETVEIDVPNPEGTFKAGMYAEVIIPVGGNTHAFVVPITAIVTTTERKYVVIAENSKAKYINITEGNHFKDSSEIFGQLNTGDMIVTNATYKIKEAESISVH
jgi:RND family efflux transporter MFP subunit